MKVTFTLATRKQVVADADPAEPFVLTVRNGSDASNTGEPVEVVEMPFGAAVELELPSGSYKAIASRYNFEAVAMFTVKDVETMSDVPDSLSVVIG